MTGPTREYIDPNLGAAHIVIGSRQVQPRSIAAGQQASFPPASLGMLVAATVNPNGAAEANQTNYFLNYNTGSGDPPVIGVKLDGQRVVSQFEFSAASAARLAFVM